MLDLYWTVHIATFKKGTMSTKTRNIFDEMQEEEERRWAKVRKAMADQRKKEEKRKAKQEKQRASAKTDAYTKKVEQNTPPPITITELRLSQLRLLGLTAAQDNPVAIRSAYRRLALRYHPDKNPTAEATEMFKKILGAYEALL